MRECSLHKSLHERRWYRDSESIDHHAVDTDESSLGVNQRTSRVTGCESDIGDDPARRLGSVVSDCVQNAHRQRIADPQRMPVCENELSSAKSLGIANLEQRPANRWRCEKSQIMMGMVRECVRFAPLAGGVHF